jgi:Ribonuclease G/E
MTIYHYARIGEDIYAKIEDGKIITLRIVRFGNESQPRFNQEYCGRIKTIDMRLSAAFVDIGNHQGLMQFSHPRPQYIVEGRAIICKVKRPPVSNKLATLQYIGDAKNNAPCPQLIEDAPEFGDWDEPITAGSFEIELINAAISQLSDIVIPLRNGGNIAIETTRALTSFDVDAANRIAGGKNQANFNHKLNLEAAQEIARQIILRNIGGLIVIDFVGAPQKIEATQLLEVLRNHLKDKTICEILPLSKFGLCEISRAKNNIQLSELFAPDNYETIAINAINSLSQKLWRAKGQKQILQLNPNAKAFLENWKFDWQKYLHENVGGVFEIQTAQIDNFEIIESN